MFQWRKLCCNPHLYFGSANVHLCNDSDHPQKIWSFWGLLCLASWLYWIELLSMLSICFKLASICFLDFKSFRMSSGPAEKLHFFVHETSNRHMQAWWPLNHAETALTLGSEHSHRCSRTSGSTRMREHYTDVISRSTTTEKRSWHSFEESIKNTVIETLSTLNHVQSFSNIIDFVLGNFMRFSLKEEKLRKR